MLVLQLILLAIPMLRKTGIPDYVQDQTIIMYVHVSLSIELKSSSSQPALLMHA